MGFNELINKGTQNAFLRLSNVDVVIQFGGVPLKTIRGVFDEDSQSVSPYEASQMQIKPAVSVQTSDFTGIDSSHTFMISNREYRLDGKPRPDGAGLTIIYLSAKK
jgi:hypothetical protein